MRKILHIFLSLVIVFGTTVPAYASSSWAMQSISSSGASAVISAAKTGFRSTITHAPSAAAVGRALVAGAGIGAFAYAASQLLGAGVDYVMTSGGDIKYKGAPTYDNPEDICRSTISSPWVYRSYRQISEFGYMCVASYGNDSPVDYQNITLTQIPGEDKIIPLSDVAAKVIANAASGHAASQEAVRSAAASDFNTGSLDSKLQDTAVPSDAPYDAPDGVVPFDPSSIISALQSLMSAVTNMASSLSAKIQTMTSTLSGKMDEMIGKQTETTQVINDGMADVVAANNATGARVGDVVAAIEGLEGNTLDGQVINDAVDKAIAAGHTDAASIVAAIEGLEGNSLDSSVINEAVDRVIENNKAIADKVAAEKVAADEKVAAEKAAADKAAADQFEEVPPEKTQSETDVPVDLPPEVKNPNEFDVDYVSFSGQCPVLSPFSVGVGAFSSSMTFDMSPLCNLAITIRPAIIAIAYFIGLGVIASAIRET